MNAFDQCIETDGYSYSLQIFNAARQLSHIEAALKRTGFPECIYILTERDKIIVHWLLCMIFFALSNR